MPFLCQYCLVATRISDMFIVILLIFRNTLYVVSFRDVAYIRRFRTYWCHCTLSCTKWWPMLIAHFHVMFAYRRYLKLFHLQITRPDLQYEKSSNYFIKYRTHEILKCDFSGKILYLVSCVRLVSGSFKCLFSLSLAAAPCIIMALMPFVGWVIKIGMRNVNNTAGIFSCSLETVWMSVFFDCFMKCKQDIIDQLSLVEVAKCRQWGKGFILFEEQRLVCVY